MSLCFRICAFERFERAMRFVSYLIFLESEFQFQSLRLIKRV